MTPITSNLFYYPMMTSDPAQTTNNNNNESEYESKDWDDPTIDNTGVFDPMEWIDPITREVIKEPKVLLCGHSFEAKTIDKWLSQSPKSQCPTCKKKDQVATVNHAVAPMLQRWHNQNRKRINVTENIEEEQDSLSKRSKTINVRNLASRSLNSADHSCILPTSTTTTTTTQAERNNVQPYQNDQPMPSSYYSGFTESSTTFHSPPNSSQNTRVTLPPLPAMPLPPASSGMPFPTMWPTQNQQSRWQSNNNNVNHSETTSMQPIASTNVAQTFKNIVNLAKNDRYKEFLESLVQNITKKVDENGNTLLHSLVATVVKVRYLEVVFNKEPDILDKTNNDGETALDVADRRMNVRHKKKLEEFGATSTSGS